MGSSRQHVVDLCDKGVLAHVRVGKHRRIRRCDVDALLRPSLTRDQLKALWLHRAVAGKLVASPEMVLDKARQNLARLHQIHPTGMTAAWLDAWESTLRSGVEAVLDVLTSRDPHAVELRQNSPFAGVLSEQERHAVLDAFVNHWNGERAA